MPDRNHVILLRHCVRSNAGPTIKVCDGVNGKSRKVKLSEFTDAPLPKWDVPPMQCTARGYRIIEQLGKYLVDNVVRVAIGQDASDDAPPPPRVVVRIISDDFKRDWETSLALLKGMKKALNKTPYGGLDQVSIRHDVFGSSTSWPNETTCPPKRSLSKEMATGSVISDRISRYLPLSEFNVREVLDSIVAIGGLNPEAIRLGNESVSLNNDRQCPGGLGLSLTLLDSIAEMAVFSRASHINPPFLPTASDDDVYRLARAADYVNTVKKMDNKGSAKRGLILMKSVLEALRTNADGDEGGTSSSQEGEVVTVTVYAGHNTNVNDVATTVGLRWTMPPPYAQGSDAQTGKLVSVPPGSGVIFSSSPGTDDDVSLSYVVPVNLIGNGTTKAFDHQLLPINTIDMAEPELAVRDGIGSENAAISMNELRRRLEATMNRYPDLRSCHEDAPIFLGLNDFREQNDVGDTISFYLLVTLVVVNLVGCAAFAVAQYRRSSHKYKRVQSDELPEEEPFYLASCSFWRRGLYNCEIEMKVGTDHNNCNKEEDVEGLRRRPPIQME